MKTIVFTRTALPFLEKIKYSRNVLVAQSLYEIEACHQTKSDTSTKALKRRHTMATTACTELSSDFTSNPELNCHRPSASHSLIHSNNRNYRNPCQSGAMFCFQQASREFHLKRLKTEGRINLLSVAQ